MKRRTVIAAIGLLLMLLLAQFPARAEAQAEAVEPLRLGVHPYLPRMHIRQRFTPLVEYLSRMLAVPVVLVVAPDYRSHIRSLAQGELDLAYMGPAMYVKLVEEFGPHPLIARQEVQGQPHFNGVIIVRQGSPVTELAQLKGKRFAFGDPSSTMSHLVPRWKLREAGVTVADLSGYAFLGSHHAVAIAVLRGEFQAGAVKQGVFARLHHRGLRELALTPTISEHLFIARQGLSEDLIEELRRVFLGLSESAEGQQVLLAIKGSLTGMVRVEDSDYDNLREIIWEMREAGVKL